MVAEKYIHLNIICRLRHLNKTGYHQHVAGIYSERSIKYYKHLSHFGISKIHIVKAKLFRVT